MSCPTSGCSCTRFVPSWKHPDVCTLCSHKHKLQTPTNDQAHPSQTNPQFHSYTSDGVIQQPLSRIGITRANSASLLQRNQSGVPNRPPSDQTSINTSNSSFNRNPNLSSTGSTSGTQDPPALPLRSHVIASNRNLPNVPESGPTHNRTSSEPPKTNPPQETAKSAPPPRPAAPAPAAPPPRPSVPAPSTVPVVEEKTSSTRFSIFKKKKEPTLTISGPTNFKRTASMTVKNGAIQEIDPAILKMLNELDVALKKQGKRGLTKREADQLIKSGHFDKLIKSGGAPPKPLSSTPSSSQSVSQVSKAISSQPASKPLPQTPNASLSSSQSKPLPSIPPKSQQVDQKSISVPRSPRSVAQSDSRQLRALQQALERETAAHKAAELELTTFMENAEKRREAYEYRLRELTTRLQEQDHLLSESAQRIQNQEQQIQEYGQKSTADLNELKKAFDEQQKKREADFRALLEDLNSERAGRVELEQMTVSLGSKLADQSNQLSRVERERSTLADELQEVRTQTNAQVQKISQFSETQLKQLESKMKAEELARITAQQKVTELERQLATRASSSSTPSREQRTQYLTQIERLTQQKNQLEDQCREFNAQVNIEQKKTLDAESARQEMFNRLLELQLQFADQLESIDQLKHKSRTQTGLLPALMKEFQKSSTEFQSMIQVLSTIASKPQMGAKSAIDPNAVQSLQQCLSQTVEKISDWLSGNKEIETLYHQRRSEFLAVVQRTREAAHSAETKGEAANKETYQKELIRLKQSMGHEINSLNLRLENEIEKRLAAEARLGDSGDSSGLEAVGSSGELSKQFHEEIQRRQELEEENRRLQLQVNTMEVISTDSEKFQSQWISERTELLDEHDETKQRMQTLIDDLQAQVARNEQDRTRMENTRLALESQVEILSLSKALDPQGTSPQEGQKELDQLREQVHELQTKLKLAEDRAYANSTAQAEIKTSASDQQIRDQLKRALQENASLSAQLQAANAELQSFDAFEEPSAPVSVNHTLGGSAPPPPPPPPMGGPPPPPPMSGRSAGSGESLMDALKNTDRSKLKAPQDVPAAVVGDPGRGDLMSEIRNRSIQLRSVQQSDEQVDVSGQSSDTDPQNMLQVLARVLLARREGIEEDDEDLDGDDDELWDDN